MTIELVLPSGRFARQIRKPTMLDLAVSLHDNAVVTMLVLAHRTIEVDGKVLEFQEWMEMDAEEFFPLVAVLGREMKAIAANMKGIA